MPLAMQEIVDLHRGLENFSIAKLPGFYEQFKIGAVEIDSQAGQHRPDHLRAHQFQAYLGIGDGKREKRTDQKLETPTEDAPKDRIIDFRLWMALRADYDVCLIECLQPKENSDFLR